jgi:hypothetical protein
MTASLANRDVLDLVVTRAEGDFRMHLAEDGRARSLCGQLLRAKVPHHNFREAGCETCHIAALNTGTLSTRASDHAWISLRRV